MVASSEPEAMTWSWKGLKSVSCRRRKRWGVSRELTSYMYMQGHGQTHTNTTRPRPTNPPSDIIRTYKTTDNPPKKTHQHVALVAREDGEVEGHGALALVGDRREGAAAALYVCVCVRVGVLEGV